MQQIDSGSRQGRFMASLGLGLGVGLFLMGTAPALAQRPDRAGSRGGREASIAGLKIGDLAPDVQIYDEQGKAHAFRDVLKGHTTALIFGCLT